MFSLQLMQQILNYLITRPYQEVAILIDIIKKEDQQYLENQSKAIKLENE